MMNWLDVATLVCVRISGVLLGLHYVLALFEDRR